MGRATFVLGRILAMGGAQVCIGWLHSATLGASGGGNAWGESLSVFRTVYTQCILILVTLLYYFVWKSCSMAVRAGIRRSTIPLPSEHEYGVGSRFTIRNVWVFVFGMGLVLFIVAYCFAGLNSVCLIALGLALAVVSVDEITTPRREYPTPYTVGRTCVLVCGVMSLCLVAPRFLSAAMEDFVRGPDIYSLLFGIALPVFSQLTLSVVRDLGRYRLRRVCEMCEFGFPFTAFLGVFHLCVAYGQREQADSDALSVFASATNHTIASVYFDFQYWYHFNDSTINAVISTDGPFLLFYLLTPWLYVPACVCFVWCVLEGAAIDPLLAVATVLSVEYPSDRGPTSWDIVATVFCWLAVCMRVVCEYRPNTLSVHTPVYSAQGSFPQLPPLIARWGGNRTPTMRECEAETMELADDFPQSRTTTPDLIHA